MRIVLTVNFSPWSAYSGGGQRSTHELATALSRRGHEVTTVYTRPPWERVDLPHDLPYGVVWAAFAGLRSRSGAPLRPLNALPVAAAVRRLARDAARPTVMHAQGEEGALLPRLVARGRTALVVTPRYPSYPNGLFADRRTAVGKLRRVLVPPKYLLLGAALRGADRWCPTSRASARSVGEAYGLPESRCTVVPNGVAAPFLEARRHDDAAGGPILFFGRLSHTKGAATLLEALARLDGEAPRATLVGRGPEEPHLRRLAGRLGLGDRVHFAGWRGPAELAALLAGASMAVLPSREESFGNAMVEAMAAGTPLITTRVGSVPEIMLGERTGLLVPPDDPQALAEAIRRLRADPETGEAMGRAGRAHVLARFSWDASARAFEDVYTEALAHP